MGKRLSFDEQAFVADCASGFYTHRQLAQRYGMSPHTAGKIARGQRRPAIARQAESARRAARLRTERAVCERADRVVAMLDELMAGEDKRLAFAATREILHHLIGRPAGVLELRAADRAALEEEEGKNRDDADAAEDPAEKEARARAKWLASPFRQAAIGHLSPEEQAEWEKEVFGDDEDDEDDENGADEAADRDQRGSVPPGSTAPAGIGQTGREASVSPRWHNSPSCGGLEATTLDSSATRTGQDPICASPGTSGTSAGAAAKPQVASLTDVTANAVQDVPVYTGPKTGTLRAHPAGQSEPPALTYRQKQLHALAAKRGHCTLDDLIRWWRETWTGYMPEKHDYEDALHAAGLWDQITPATFRMLLAAP